MSWNWDEYCLPCWRKMETDRAGIEVLEMDVEGEPYKLWNADVLICPVCGQTVVTRFGGMPVSQQGQKGFDRRVKEAQSKGVLEMTHPRWRE